jgi:tRNA pseudouridine55 synthase
MSGFLLIDKPSGITSHDVIDRVRRITGERRVGHAGTLDPFATGLLIVGVSREATREMKKLVGLNKTYETEFVLGASSDTDDVTGKFTPHSSSEPLTQIGIQETLQKFVGEIEQIPPAYSAIKIGGKKMYEEARAGRMIEAKPRRVTIYSIDHVIASARQSVSDDGRRPQANEAISTLRLLRPVKAGLATTVVATIHCSSGAYIRSLARDLGRALHTGGYVQTLRRTHIGPFSIKESTTLELLSHNGAQSHLIPISVILSRL